MGAALAISRAERTLCQRIIDGEGLGVEEIACYLQTKTRVPKRLEATLRAPGFKPQQTTLSLSCILTGCASENPTQHDHCEKTVAIYSSLGPVYIADLPDELNDVLRAMLSKRPA